MATTSAAAPRASLRPLWPLILGLFAAAAAIRLYRIDEPLLDFNPNRQYRNALVRRGLEVLWRTGELPAVDRANWDYSYGSEFPVVDYAVAGLYRLWGREELWLGRAFSALAWLLGGCIVYRIACRLGSREAGLAAAAVHLLAPFGVLASRSIQHDAWMVTAMLLATSTLLHFFARPGRRRFLLAAAAAAAATLLKPTCLPIVLGACALPLLARRGLARSALPAAGYALLAVLPLGVWALLRPEVERFEGYAAMFFEARLLLEAHFWRDWLAILRGVTGLPLLLAGLWGAALARGRIARRLLLGLWLGYLAFGLSFNVTSHSHHYYSLALVPIVALSLGAGVDRLLGLARRAGRAFPARLVLLAWLAGASLLWLRAARNRIDAFDYRHFLAQAEALGAALEHSSRVIAIPSARFGLPPYLHHGRFAAAEWPTGLGAELPPQAGARIARHAPVDFFLVLEPAELRHQSGLRTWLGEHAALTLARPDLLVFDLRRPQARR